MIAKEGSADDSHARPVRRRQWDIGSRRDLFGVGETLRTLQRLACGFCRFTDYFKI